MKKMCEIILLNIFHFITINIFEYGQYMKVYRYIHRIQYGQYMTQFKGNYLNVDNLYNNLKKYM